MTEMWCRARRIPAAGPLASLFGSWRARSSCIVISRDEGGEIAS
jgi:hypothetical protein